VEAEGASFAASLNPEKSRASL